MVCELAAVWQSLTSAVLKRVNGFPRTCSSTIHARKQKTQHGIKTYFLSSVMHLPLFPQSTHTCHQRQCLGEVLTLSLSCSKFGVFCACCVVLGLGDMSATVNHSWKRKCYIVECNKCFRFFYILLQTIESYTNLSQTKRYDSDC